MNNRIIQPQHLAPFADHLHESDHAAGTIDKYCRDLRQFSVWLAGRSVTSGRVVDWSRYLLIDCGYAAATVNSKLGALHSFFTFIGWQDCRVHYLKCQRRLFRDARRNFTRQDYDRLLSAAYATGRERLALVIETIAATGIRVSELPYITRDALEDGRADIALKGKIRTILLPRKLCRKLKRYARKEKIAAGALFITDSGQNLSRKQIWKEMKALSARSGVPASKIFPHNLRHLFATTYYQVSKDIVRLADILGHSSIETTRIYLIGTGDEHQRQLEQLGFVRE